MKNNILARVINVTLVVLLGLVFIVGSGGGSDSDDSVVSTVSNETNLSSNAVLLPQDDESNITNKQLLDSGNVSFDLSTSYLEDTVLVEGNVIHIPAEDDGHFPLGMSGKIESLSEDGDSTTVTLSPVKLSEIVEDSIIEPEAVDLTGDNLIAVISPNAVREAAENSSTLQQRSAGSDVYKSFLNGAVIVKKSSLQQRDTFLGDSGVITPDTIELELPPLFLKDMVDDPSRLQPLQTSVESQVVVSGSLSNLVLEQWHDISLSEGLKSIRLSVAGDLSANVEFSGGVSYTAGYYSQAWKEVEEDQFEKLGQTADISGLDGKDKIGKYPIAGLVFSVDCTATCKYGPGKTQSPLRKAKKGGVILWVYINAKGELSFETNLGVETNLKFQLGAEKKEGEKLANISYLENPDDGERVLKAPYFNGKVNLTADLGISIDADFFVFGVRPAGLGLNAIGRFSGGISTLEEMSYGLTEFGGDWSWEAGKVCTEASLGGGAILSTVLDFGYEADIDIGWYEDTIEGNPTYFGQWPTDEEARQPGWSGLKDITWYTGQIYNKCYPSLKAPVIAAEPKNKSVLISWEAEEDISYDLCYSNESISDPLKCTANGGELLSDVTPNHLVENLINEQLYHFVVTAKYKYIVVEDERVETADSNHVSATPTAGLSITIPALVFVKEGEDKKVPYQTSSSLGAGSNVTACSTEFGDELFIISGNYEFTAPNIPAGQDELKFTVTCTLTFTSSGDESFSESASDQSLVTVTKNTDIDEPEQPEEPPVVPVDTKPTVGLPLNSVIAHGSPYTVTPTVTDDNLSLLTYKWSVDWDTSNASAGSTGSLTQGALSLNAPSLEPGQSGSVAITLKVTDSAGQSASDSVVYSYNLDKYIALELPSFDFVDGTILERGTKKTLTWTVKNLSNVDLEDVALFLKETTDKLIVSDISPAQVETWKEQESKTFTVEVEVPNDVVNGEHRKEWTFTHNNGDPLSYENQSDAANLFFEFVTEDPSDLLARLLINSTHIEAGDTVYGAVEVHSGNAPYSMTVDWGDGSAVDAFEDVTENYTIESETYARQALEHKYEENGLYNVVVNVTDAAGESISPPLYDQITVSSTQITEWAVDVRDIDTSEHDEDIAFTSEPHLHEDTGITVGKYTTDWSPIVDPDSDEYFVKYRLPVPKNVLSLGKKLRIGTSILASEIAAYDREFAFRTQSGKEYTAAIIDIDHEDDGYLRKRDMTTDTVDLTRYPILVDDVKDTKYANYTLVIEPTQMAIWKEAVNEEENRELAVYGDSLESEYVSEIDITFKGNGTIQGVVLQYDQDGDGEFSSSESILLNTVDKSVDWSTFGSDIVVTTSKLNDTGITQCSNASENGLSCPTNSLSYANQDAEYGRDVTHNDDSDGHAGFSFIKLDSDGKELLASASNWSCVKDNVTGLMWEVKQDSNLVQGDEGLHDVDDRYTWYSNDSSINGGGNGSQGSGRETCRGYRLDVESTYCNTKAYVDRVNSQSLCGQSDWRLPSREELRSIIDYGHHNPSIDTQYFPNTKPYGYWSSSSHSSSPERAWVVMFGYGHVEGGSNGDKGNLGYIRLVRSDM